MIGEMASYNANVAKEDYAGVGAFSSPRLLGVDQFRPVPKVPSFGKDLDAQMNIADIDHTPRARTPSTHSAHDIHGETCLTHR